MSRLSVGLAATVGLLVGMAVLFNGSGRQAETDRDSSTELESALEPGIVRSQVLKHLDEAQPYTAPTEEDLETFRELASVGSIQEARRVAPRVGYGVQELASGVLLLHGTVGGWGTFVLRPSGADVIVEVPHPFDEPGTAEIGSELFERASARALLIAGAGRNAAAGGVSDVAHADGTVFDAVHDALLPSELVIQLHGFRSRPGLPEIVLSTGERSGSGLDRMSEALSSRSFTVGTWRGDRELRRYAATTNIQGISTRASGGTFMHVELSSQARQASRRPVLVESLRLGVRDTRASASR